ncbi:MAG: DUF1615 family protein [Aestuariivirga sp.]
MHLKAIFAAHSNGSSIHGDPVVCARYTVALTALLFSASLSLAQESVPASFTVKAINAAEKGVKDTKGWAADLHAVLVENGFPPSKENVCATIAIIDQESGFAANPAVPGLGRLAENAISEKLRAYPIIGLQAIDYLERTPSPDDSFMQRIRTSRTERDLDLAYRSLVAHAADRASIGVALNSGLLNRVIEDRNEISTIGSMQVSVEFALETERDKRWTHMTLKDVYAVRDALYTRKGGMLYGTRLLLGYETGYDKKVYRFADYNAGRYASRNAAFQFVVSELSGADLSRDGDLLSYRGSRAAKDASKTESAIQAAVKQLKLTLTGAEIRRDLLKEKSKEFDKTSLFRLLRQGYEKRFGKAAPFAMIPEIELSSIKITRKMTTRNFAESVDRRYRRCMAVK